MIRVEFTKSGELLTSFSVSGHAGYDDYGHDIVCASVTSAVQLTANGITEVLKLPAKVKFNPCHPPQPAKGKRAAVFAGAAAASETAGTGL